MREIIGFVITAKCADEIIEYFAVDNSCSGWYWNNRITAAKIFPDIETAKNRLCESDFNKSDVMTNGEVFPPSAIHNASKVCYKKPKCEVVISIKPLVVDDCIFENTYVAEIKKPTGFKYD